MAYSVVELLELVLMTNLRVVVGEVEGLVTVGVLGVLARVYSESAVERAVSVSLPFLALVWNE